MKSVRTKIRAIKVVAESRLITIPEDEDFEECLEEKILGYESNRDYLQREGEGKIEEFPPLFNVYDDRSMPPRVVEKLAIKVQDFQDKLDKVIKYQLKYQLNEIFSEICENQNPEKRQVIFKKAIEFFEKNKVVLGINNLNDEYIKFKPIKFSEKLLDLYEYRGSSEFLRKEEGVLIFFNRHSEDINPSNFLVNNIDTPMSIAIKSGAIKLVECLIEFGVDLKKRLGENGDSYLHLAVANDQAEIAYFLVEYGGVATEVVNRSHETPLMVVERKIAGDREQKDLEWKNLRSLLMGKFVNSYNKFLAEKELFYGEEELGVERTKQSLKFENIVQDSRYMEHLKSLIVIESQHYRQQDNLRRTSPQASVVPAGEEFLNLVKQGEFLER